MNNEIDEEIYSKISTILKRMGISPDKNGYHYLRAAIYLCYKNPEYMTKISSMVYPFLEKEFQKTQKNIEKTMRTAIENGWGNSDYNLAEELFQNIVKYNKTKPTNGEFIATIADTLLYDKEKIDK